MLKINQVLQRGYLITRLLGRGGMGAVYEARHIELDRVCVVKEMLPPDEPEQGDVLAKQFKREAKILAGLKHPNLPHVSDYFTENGNYYLVMDLIDGQSLDKLIGPTGLPEATVLKYADQLLEVLAYVHAQGALHRDIKPANIIVQPDGRVVLVDFGLAKVEGGMVTNVSMRGLTPHYAPPEQYIGGTDARADLYSLAATLYQTLTGKLPLSATDQSAGGVLTSVRQLRPDISANTARVIMKSLMLDRNKRCQSAAEMRAALRSAEVKGVAVIDNSTWKQIAFVVMAVVVIVLLAVIIVPALTQKPVAPTASPTRLPTWTAASVTSTPVPKPTVTLASMDTPVPSATNTPVPAPLPTPTAPNNDLLLTLAPGVTISMVRIPAGEFLMGSTDSNQSDEKPQHSVTLSDYLIGKYDVTNAQYAAYAQAKELNWSMPAGKENHPVVSVSWDDAVAFCMWAAQVTGRKVTLPTEAQWEKAARGTDGRIYPWGNEAPDNTRANFNNNVGSTTEVGKYSPKGDSPYSLADMAGNVWQWTADWYSDTYYASSSASNPQGPTTGSGRVVRGGSWSDFPAFVRAAFRDRFEPSLRLVNLGFRVAVSAPGS